MSIQTKTRTKNVRVTLDLPVEIHKQIKTLASQKGETLRQLFIDLASAKIANQNPQGNQKTNKTIRKIPKGIPLGIDNIDLQKVIDESLWPKF